MVVTLEPNAFESAVRVRRRPRFTVEPASIAWDAVAFTVRGAREAVACVPRDSLEPFLDDLDAGRLDQSIEAFLASPPAGRVLRASAQAAKPGLFDAMGSPGAIVPDERVPGRGPLGLGVGGAGGTPVDARRNKDRHDRPRRRPRFPKRVLVSAGAAVATVGVAAAVVVAAQSGGGSSSQQVAASGAPSTVPVPSATAAVASAPPASLLAASPRCSEEPGLKSTKGDTPAVITFTNDTDQPLHAYWLSYDGKRVFYQEVPPHKSVQQATFVTHPWVLADTTDRCLGLEVVTGGTAGLKVPQG